MRLLIVLMGTLAFANGYTYTCLREECTCDTVTEVIFCNDKQLRHFPVVSDIVGQLRGFTILSLRDNDIHGRMPTKQQLLAKLPDLKFIDLHYNPRVSCSQIEQLQSDDFEVISKCSEDPTEYVAPTGRPVRKRTDCNGNLVCQVEQYYLKLAKHAGRAWRTISKELDKLSKNPLLKPIVAKMRDAWHRVVGGRGHAGVKINFNKFKFWE